MDGSIRGFWGKLERDGDLPVRWHSLEDHLADVSACFEALLERTILGPRLARLLGQERLSDSLVARLCVFAALHDIGKLNHGFQRRSDPEARRVAGHVSTALIALGSYAPLAAEIAGAGLLAWGEPPAWEGLLRATICHHGYPVIEANEPFDRSLWEDSELRSPLAGLRSILGRVREWYPLAFAEGPPLPREPEFHHAFSGLVTLADWLGSDQRLFPFSAEPGDRIAFARERAQRALGAMGLLPAGARASLGALPIGFERISAWAPRPMQRCIAELPLHPAGSLTILESDTGSGKTEAALAHYLRLFQDHLVDGLYFALPTRTAATQIFRRTHESVMRAFPDPEQRPPVVLAVPGYLRFDEVQGKLLAPFEVLWPDEGRDRHRSWAAEHPKRFLAAAVAIGTIDQALLSTVKTKHAQMRASALMRQLLVVDEVHASDAYMNELLGHVLRHHLRAGGHALLMSATLGAEARARLMRAAGGSGQCLGLDAALQLPYPLVEDAPLGAPARRLVVEPDRLGQQIQVALRGIAADPDAIAAAAIDAAERGARVLILRNTVCDCVATQQALDAELERRGRPELAFRVEGVAAPHHSRFAKVDRERLDVAIEAAFGKASSSGQGCVAVATQTVQQSLDLDADWMITDLCPMDVLLQRVGRLHRHRQERARPPGFDAARVLVLTPAERDLSGLLRRVGQNDVIAQGGHGHGRVYDNLCILEATLRLLEAHDTLRIPEMNRELVERATHPAILDPLARELGQLWPAHLQTIRARRIADRVQGRVGLLDRRHGFDSNELRWTKKGESIPTRLGEDDRRACLPAPALGPFGEPISELRLPAWLARGWSEEPSIAVDQAAGGFVLRVDGNRYVYDRLGLRGADAEGEELADD